MNRDTIIDNEFLTLWYYPSEKIVHHQIHKYLYGTPLRDGLLKGAELLKVHEASKWLSDDRNNSAMHPSDIEWGKKVFFPIACQAGWKYWAVVLPIKIIGQMNAKNLVRGCLQDGLSAEVFEEPEQAMDWLCRQ